MTRPLLLAVALLATAASAELPTLSASVGYTSQIFPARGYDLVDSDDHLSMVRAALGTGFLLPFGLLDLELAYQGGGTTAQAHATVPTSFSLVGAQLGATLRLPVRAWFHPYAHLSGGVDWATLTLASPTRLTQTVLTGSGQGLLGVQLSVRLGRNTGRRLPWLVFDLGGGAVVRSVARFDALRPEPASTPPPDALASGQVDVGALPLTGYTFRLLVGVRF